MLRVPKLVVLNLTTDCNMRCEYCYASAGEHQSYMKFDTAIKTIEQLRKINNYNKVKVLFHGGEPLLCYDVIVKIIEHYKTVGLQDDLDYYIQTNCILLDEKKIIYFKNNNVKISISIDGCDKSSNKCRILANGENSIEYIKKAINIMNKHNIKINALAVLNKNNYLKVGEIIDFFVKNNIKDFSFNYFIKGGRGNKNSYLALSNEEVFLATKIIINKIQEYYKKGILLNEKNVYYLIKTIKTKEKKYMCANTPCGAGLNIFGITPNGNIFPCDDLSSQEQFKLGNINENKLEDILSSNVVSYFANCRYEHIKECSNCDLNKYCGAGCCSRKFYENNTIYSQDPICGFYKLVIPFLKAEIEKGKVGDFYD